MSSIPGIIVGILMAIAIGVFVWYVWHSNQKLDLRLASGDVTLLSSPNYKVSEVIRAPMGSRVDKVAPMMMMQQNGIRYVRQMLPDGRMALVPVMAANQQIIPAQQTMHNTQPPQEQ